MIRYHAEATIRRSPSEVFAALLDAQRYSDWTDMTDMRWEAEGPPHVGTRGRFRLPKSPFSGDLGVEIVELESDRRVVFRVTHPNLTWINWADLAPEGDGTHLTYAGEMTLHGWRRILEPVIRSEVTRGETAEVQRLKNLLEADTAVAVPA